jgi:hypothetical protein
MNNNSGNSNHLKIIQKTPEPHIKNAQINELQKTTIPYGTNIKVQKI